MDTLWVLAVVIAVVWIIVVFIDQRVRRDDRLSVRWLGIRMDSMTNYYREFGGELSQLRVANESLASKFAALSKECAGIKDDRIFHISGIRLPLADKLKAAISNAQVNAGCEPEISTEAKIFARLDAIDHDVQSALKLLRKQTVAVNAATRPHAATRKHQRA